MLKGRIFNSSGLKRCLTDFKKFCLLRHKACFSSLTSSRSLTTLNSNSVSFGKKQFTCQTFVSASCKYRKYHCGLPKKFQVGVYGLTCYCGSVRHYCAPCWHRQTNINRQTWRYPVPSITQIIVPPITVMSRSIVTEKTIAAESPVKTVSTTKKRVARKKTHDKEVIADHKNMAAYAVGNELYIDQVEIALREQSLYETVNLPVDITDALMATAKYRVDGKAREIYFFEDGSVVCWNMPASERLEVVKFAQKCCEMPFDTQLVLDESEVMSVVSDSVTALKGSTLHIRANADTKQELNDTIFLEKFAFSNAVAQSVTLSMKEVSLDFFVESIEPKTEDLRDGKDVRMTRRALNKMLGEIFHLRHDINLRSDFLDTPDVYWEREELEILYKSMCTYLNLPKRTKVMNEKLNYCTQILELFSSQMNDERHVRLEWMIIALILVEVVFETSHYVERYIDRIEAKKIERQTFLTEELQNFGIDKSEMR